MEGAKGMRTNAPLDRAVLGVCYFIKLGIKGASKDRKSVRLWQILVLERVEAGPVDHGLLEMRAVDRRWPDLLLELLLEQLLLFRGDIVHSIHPQSQHLAVYPGEHLLGATPGLRQLN